MSVRPASFERRMARCSPQTTNQPQRVERAGEVRHQNVVPFNPSIVTGLRNPSSTRYPQVVVESEILSTCRSSSRRKQ